MLVWKIFFFLGWIFNPPNSMNVYLWNCWNSLFFDPFVNGLFDYTNAMTDLRSLKVSIYYLQTN